MAKPASVSIQLTLSNKELNEVVVIANKNSFKTNRVSGSSASAKPHPGNSTEHTGSYSKADQ